MAKTAAEAASAAVAAASVILATAAAAAAAAMAAPAERASNGQTWSANTSLMSTRYQQGKENSSSLIYDVK